MLLTPNRHILVDVDAIYRQSAFVLPGDPFEAGFEGATRWTAGLVEIERDGARRAQHLHLKVGHRDGLYGRSSSHLGLS